MYYYVEPGDNDAVARAFRKCGQLMQTNNHLDMALVVPQLANLEGLISDCLGEKPVSALAKNKSIDLNPGLIRLFTRRLPPRFFKGPLLVAFTATDQLQSVIKSCPGADIVFIPWAPSERDFFVNTYKPELI